MFIRTPSVPEKASPPRVRVERGSFRGPLDASLLTAWASVHGLAMLITAGVDVGVDNEEKLRALFRSTARQVIDGLAAGS